MNSRQQSCSNLLATDNSKEKSSRLTEIDFPGKNSMFVQHRSKMSNLTKVESESVIEKRVDKVESETVVAKIVRKASRKISDKASAYSKYSKGSNPSP